MPLKKTVKRQKKAGTFGQLVVMDESRKTQIDTFVRARKDAGNRRYSISQLIRDAIEEFLAAHPVPSAAKKPRKKAAKEVAA